MIDKPAHLCLTCNLAEWYRTTNGRILPDGEGKCGWDPNNIAPAVAWKSEYGHSSPCFPKATAWKWGVVGFEQPEPELGGIDRNRPITECETYEAKS